MECKECHKIKKIHAYGLCGACCQKRYRRLNPDKVRANSKRSYEKHKIRRRSESRGKESISMLYSSFRSTNKKRGYAVAITLEDLKSLFKTMGEWYLANCAYCKCAIVVGFNVTLDHMVPNGDTTLSNIIPACRHCNTSKGRFSVKDFKARLLNETELLKEIQLKNAKELKSWLVSEVWKGTFNDLISLLFHSGTSVPHPKGISSSKATETTTIAAA